MKVTYQERIKAPAARVYELISDVEQHSAWLDSCEGSSWTGSARGVGATFRQTTKGTEREGMVSAAEDDRQMTFTFSGAGQPATTIEFALEPISQDVTQLTFTVLIDFQQGPGCLAFVFKFVGRRFEQAAREQLHGSFAKLKRLAEGAA